MISVCTGGCLIKTPEEFNRLRTVKRSPEFRRLRSSVCLSGLFGALSFGIRAGWISWVSV